MFNITDEQLMANGIKIVDGIAGGGKSSLIDKFFKEHDISYARLTSTNRLSRDASDRYNMPVKTIAAGMFKNNGTYFYAEEKDPIAQNMVIDEILQTDPRAIEWCINHADTTNIIITTDSKQMMSPDNEERMIKAFTELRLRKDVIYRNVTKTLRARNAKTEKIYNELYGKAELPILYTTKNLIKTFPNVIRYEEMEYSPDNAYITHDNATEDYLYRDKEFASNPYLDLIPKGCIASKPPKDLHTYPMLSQNEAKRTHCKAYTQVMNVGSAVRFQGSEVMDNQKLYFLLQPDSMVSARELYTVITRMWDIDSFVIVLVNTPETTRLSKFNNLPIKNHAYLTLDESHDKVTLTNNEMEKFMKDYDTDEIYYDRNEVRNTKGEVLYSRAGNDFSETPKSSVTAGSLARRDASLNYSYMEDVYKILDENNVKRITGIHKAGARKEAKYELDLFSAYPTIMANEKMPADGILLIDGPYDDKINFYVYRGHTANGNYLDDEHKDMIRFTQNSIITDAMKSYIEDNDLGVCEYLFSTPYVEGCFPGAYLYKKAHDTKESKASIKRVHYGYYQKPYIKLSPNRDCYIRDEKHIYELLIAHVLSQLLYYIMTIYDILDGVSVVVDAVDFECYNEEKVKEVKDALPDYIDFRIRQTGEFFKIIDGEKVETDFILYQTYDNLPTKKEKKQSQNKAWYQNLTEEQKEERNRKRRERRAKARAEKKSKEETNHE